MLLNAAAARNKTKRYDRKECMVELKFILKAIKQRAKCGGLYIEWTGDIKKANLRVLKHLGYNIYHISDHLYEIDW